MVSRVVDLSINNCTRFSSSSEFYKNNQVYLKKNTKRNLKSNYNIKCLNMKENGHIYTDGEIKYVKLFLIVKYKLANFIFWRHSFDFCGIAWRESISIVLRKVGRRMYNTAWEYYTREDGSELIHWTELAVLKRDTLYQIGN